MRTLFVGAGATGGYFGGRLAEVGKDVTFLVRPRRAAGAGRARPADHRARRRRPRSRPRTVTADAIDGTYDVVVLAVKAYALEQAMVDLAPAVGPETVIVPLLNGMRHIDELVGAFGEERVYGGVCMIHATLDDAGDVDAADRPAPARLRAAGRRRRRPARRGGRGAVRCRVRLDARPATIVQDMWEKWVFLAGLGAATTLMRATVGDINAAPGGPAFTAGIARGGGRGGHRGRPPAAGRARWRSCGPASRRPRGPPRRCTATWSGARRSRRTRSSATS